MLRLGSPLFPNCYLFFLILRDLGGIGSVLKSVCFEFVLWGSGVGIWWCLCGGEGSIPSLVQWVKNRRCCSCGVGCSCSLDSIPGPGTSIYCGCCPRQKHLFTFIFTSSFFFFFFSFLGRHPPHVEVSRLGAKLKLW